MAAAAGAAAIKTAMRAVCYESHNGGAAGLKHVEVPVPSPKSGEVLIKVEAMSINPADWIIQMGYISSIPSTFPFIPVTDIAGEVVDVGPSVDNFKPGDKVVSFLGLEKGGGLAEYAITTENATVLRPPEVTALEGACLPIAAVTALQALKRLGVKFDGTKTISNVLITAASGGVGTYAVQLAKLASLHVTATCGARNIELVKSLGADEVLDYKTPEGASLRSPSGRKYDGVVHCTMATPWSTFESNLSEQGKVVDITRALSNVVPLPPQLDLMVAELCKDDMELAVGLVKEGKLRTVVDSRYPLSKAEEAWAKSMEGHATGKIIVQPDC